MDQNLHLDTNFCLLSWSSCKPNTGQLWLLEKMTLPSLKYKFDQIAFKKLSVKNFSVKQFSVKNFSIKYFTVKNFSVKIFSVKIVSVKNFSLKMVAPSKSLTQCVTPFWINFWQIIVQIVHSIPFGNCFIINKWIYNDICDHYRGTNKPHQIKISTTNNVHFSWKDIILKKVYQWKNRDAVF